MKYILARLNGKARYIVVILIILFVGVIILVSGKMNYYSQEEYFYYSKLSLINGINTTRGYAILKNANPLFTKLIFNKAYYAVLVVFKYTTLAYVSVLKLLLI